MLNHYGCVLLCCVLWQMLLPYALVEDVKSLIRAICIVGDVVTTVADVNALCLSGRC